MPRWLKKQAVLWLSRALEIDPRMLVPWTIVAKNVEVRVVGRRVWIDTEDGCQFRATALEGVTVVREADDGLAVRSGREVPQDG